MCNPTFEKETASIDVDKIQAAMRQTHSSGVNLTYEWRIDQLKTFHRLVTDNRAAICEAICLDLGRHPAATIGSEIVPVEKDILVAIKSLKKWMQPEYVPSTIAMFPAFSQVQRRPMDSPGILIISPFNYPFLLSAKALIGALAGGNPAVLKFSELCTRCCKLFKTLFDRYFDPGAVQVVPGSIPNTNALIEKPWGKVIFTGSARVGKIIGEACSKTLTPVILELGGKCPAVVDETINSKDLQNIADRLTFGKFFNAGQSCVAPDILFVHEDHVSTLCSSLIRSIESQFGKDQKQSELARMVNSASTKRLTAMIKEAEDHSACSIIYGKSSNCDPESNYVCPTLILNPPDSLKLMQEEVFGPVLPIVTFSSREEAIELVQRLPGTPLQFSVFTTKETVFKEYTDKCRSAGAFRNDCLVHLSGSHLPLGGLGTSGFGRYLGKYSFEAFTHAFPVVYRPLGDLWDLGGLRCHPYAPWKGSFMINFIFRIPDIPVLHTRKLLIFLSLLLICCSMPKEVQILKMLLADALERLVEILRE